VLQTATREPAPRGKGDNKGENTCEEQRLLEFW
jgi:hypothetical protein